MERVEGIGVDVCSIGRVEDALAKHGPRFVTRVLRPEEVEDAMPAAKLARRWALKEAVAKALGSGIGGAVGFQDIALGHTEAGAPTVTVRGHEDKHFMASVSDDAGVAVAMVVVITPEA